MTEFPPAIRKVHNERRSSTFDQLPLQVAMVAPLIFDYIGVTFTAIFYGKFSSNVRFKVTSEHHVIGIYCLIFSLYWRIQFKKADRWRRITFFYALTLNFLLCTAYFIIAIMLVQFYINVSHIQAVLASNMIVVQLIFDFPDGRAER